LIVGKLDRDEGAADRRLAADLHAELTKDTAHEARFALVAIFHLIQRQCLLLLDAIE
jgi:hypothetical protein